jgi:hypothetical protein
LYNLNLEQIVLNTTSIDTAWLLWKKNVILILDKFVKKVRIKSGKNNAWLDADIVHLSNLKATARNKALKSNNLSDWEKYRCLNNKMKKMVREKHNTFLEHCLDNIDVNPKKFWSLVSTKNKTKSIPDEINFNGTTASSPQHKAELFNQYFSSQFNNSLYDVPDVLEFVNDNLSSIVLSVDDVYQVMLDLDTSKCNGPDGIPIIVYKMCAHILAPSLCLLFNRSLLSGKLPMEFKVANVFPIFKKGEHNNVLGLFLSCQLLKKSWRDVFTM